MINPVRKRNPEVKCPKCGELGRESVSKGFKYIRHEKTTHYIGKISDQNDIQQVESSDERILTKPHAVSWFRQRFDTYCEKVKQIDSENLAT